tara:strand:+ start:5211 stop:7517 length:2307 start_codon:yes stop_codon:yes gene_type:complete
MTGNPLSGHTKGNMTLTTHTSLATPTAEDGLFDGEHIISPTLTNLYEGVHGNGILLEEDTASGDSDRNNPLNLAGNVNGKASSNHYEIVVRGGYAVIDGVVYEFGGGTTVDVDIQNASNYKSISGTVSALTTGQEALVVVYVSSVNDSTNANKRIYWEMGTPVTSGYPLAPHSFLNAPTQKGASQDVKQSVVLAVLRCVFENGSGDLNLKVTEINDKRVFIKPSPIYFTPVTSGAVAATTAVDSHTDLDNLHGGGEEVGALASSRMGAMWQSYDSEGNQVMFYSGKDSGGNRFTRRIFNSVLSSTATSITITSADENVLMLTPSGTCTVTPSGTFPDGHVITIKNLHGSNTVNFNSLGAFGQTVKQYVYDRTNTSWNSIEVLGTGTVTSIATTAPITGGTITSSGTIGISAATTSAAGSMSSADKTKLDGIEANADVTDATNVTAAGALMDSELTDLAGVKGVTISTLQVKPSEGAFANGDKTKLDGIEANADVTDATNVNAAGAIMNSDVATKGQIIVGDGSGDPTILSVGTNGHVLTADSAEASGVKWAAASGGSSYTDSEAIAAVEGEATLALTGDVTIAAGKDLTVDTDTLHVDSTNNRVGIGTTTPDMSLDVKQAITTIARVASTGSHANMRIGRANNTKDAALLFYDDMATTPSLQWRIQMTSSGTDLSIRDEDGSPDGNEIMKFKDGGGVDINADVTIAAGHDLIFGDKTAVTALGAQVVNPDAGGGNPSAAELASTQAAITALQAKLDALIASLSNIGLV